MDRIWAGFQAEWKAFIHQKMELEASYYREVLERMRRFQDFIIFRRSWLQTFRERDELKIWNEQKCYSWKL